MRKHLLLFILILIPFVYSSPKSYYLGRKGYHPVNAKSHRIKPDWLTEHHPSRVQRNPFTGKPSLEKSHDPNKYYRDNSYLTQFALTVNVGFKNIEYPYYHSDLLNDNTNDLMPTIGMNALINIGMIQRNFGFLGGFTYCFSGLKKKWYDFVPDKHYNICDYRVGITLMQYVSLGFEGEYNGYFKDLHQEGYAVDANHYGFYVMGLYKFSEHVGINADFSCIFNKQYYNYNMAYNKELFFKQGIMPDYRLSVGLSVYF